MNAKKIKQILGNANPNSIVEVLTGSIQIGHDKGKRAIWEKNGIRFMVVYDNKNKFIITEPDEIEKEYRVKLPWTFDKKTV